MRKLISTLTILAFAAVLGVLPALAQVDPEPNPPLEASCGLDIALVIDSSGSIDSTELQQVKDAFNGFVDDLLPNETEMAVVEFDTSASVSLGFTGNASDIHDAINAASSDGSTNWDDALFDARSLFPHRSNADLILFASDGNPNRSGGHTALGHPASDDGSSSSVDLDRAIEEANAAKTAGIHIKAIGIGGDLNVSNLEAISSPSDVITSDFDQLGEDLATLADELCENPQPGGSDGDDTVINFNNAHILNVVGVKANTGKNSANGGSGGDGGNGGDIYNGNLQENGGGDQEVDESSTGNGGNGGSGGGGGEITTGSAGAEGLVFNQVNTNITRIDRCACGGSSGDDTVVNSNNAWLSNFGFGKANSGKNAADGGDGSSAGSGGDIYNGVVQENGGGNQDIDDSSTGNGGNGGAGGTGGSIGTGFAGSIFGVFNILNTNETVIRR